MGKPTGFIEYLRELPVDRSPVERVRDWNEFHHHMLDEAYDASIIRLNKWIATSIARAEALIFSAVGWIAGLIAVGFGWISRVFDQFVIDLGFDQTCRGLQTGAGRARSLQHGRVQNYIQSIAVTVAVLVLVLFMWGCKGS